MNLSGFGLKEFDAVSEGILGVEAAEARERPVVARSNARGAQPFPERIQLVGKEGGVAARGRNGLLHAAVNLLAATGEPAAAAIGERRRLRDLWQPEEFGVEVSSSRLAVGGNPNLDVFDAEDSHGSIVRPHRLV